MIFLFISGVNSGYVLKTATKQGFASQQIKCSSEPFKLTHTWHKTTSPLVLPKNIKDDLSCAERRRGNTGNTGSDDRCKSFFLFNPLLFLLVLSLLPPPDHHHGPLSIVCRFD
jgi:hypothetical protein